MTALYELTKEYRSAAERLADLDMDEQTVIDTLESLAGDIEVKSKNVAFFIRNLESTASAIKQAESDMASRRKAIENRAARLKTYLLDNMMACQITKIECEYFKLSVRENPPSVVIDSVDLLPADYMRYPEPPPPVPDKVAISAALKAGEVIPGAHLERGVRLEIK